MFKFVRPTLLGLLVAGIIPVLGTSPAMALSINFTDGTWNGAQGQTSFTTHASGVDLAAAAPGTISVNYNGGPSGDNTGMDGLGIGDDEITQGGIEQLTISFEGPVTLESVYITDLFKNDNGVIGQNEIGLYSINGGTFTSFNAQQFAFISNGERPLTLNLSGVNSITFKSKADAFSDYSVKGLTYTASVPEPSTLLLLGLGFVVLAALHRKGYVPSV